MDNIKSESDKDSLTNMVKKINENQAGELADKLKELNLKFFPKSDTSKSKVHS